MSDLKVYDEKQLSNNEKLIAMRSIFQSGNNKSDMYVKNVADFIAGNFEKIDGFDFRWTSLITNNPLLFEDIDYLRVKPFIDNQITDEEKEAYVRGELTELYATFDNMLMCNLRHYDRIMAFCTMVFMHYVRIDDEYINKGLEKLPFHLSMTPTKIWCAALTSVKSTKWEMGYAWERPVVNKLLKHDTKSFFELAYPTLYNNKIFARFQEYCALRCGTSGFRTTWVSDITSNRKLSQVCAKFTKSSVAISEQQLETLFEYSKEIDGVKGKLYNSIDKCLSQLFHGDRGQYAIYLFSREYYIYTSKFTMRVHYEKGVIGKDYLANSYECFIAEEYLVPSIRDQIDWSRYKIPQHFDYDKNVLKSLMFTMLEQNYKDVIAIKRMNDYGILTKVTFKGCFANVRIIEDFMLDNRVIRTVEKTLSKRNAANYLIERGYYLFGLEKDIFGIGDVNRQSMMTHYNNYCVPVIQHMFEVVAAHELSKNEIIDVIVSGNISPNKIMNDTIRYTNIMSVDPKQIFATGIERQNRNNLGKKKSYWTAIE